MRFAPVSFAIHEYESFLSLLLYSKGVGRLGLFFPPMAALLDMAENTIHVWQLGDISSLSPFWITVASLAATVKWILVSRRLIPRGVQNGECQPVSVIPHSFGNCTRFPGSRPALC